MISSATVKSRRKRKNGGAAFLVLVTALAAFGTLMVYSASYYTAETDYGNRFYFATKQAVGLILGTGAMLFAAHFDYRKLSKGGIWYFLAATVLLVLVFVPGLSVEVYGAKRWIKLGFFTVQPSEIAKFCYIIFVAGYFAKDPNRTASFKGIILPIIAGVITCLLIILEPNMSITVCVGLLMVGMLFAAGVKKRHLALILVPAILAVPALIIAEPYRLKRLSAFIDPWSSPQGEGYQLIQSLYALGSGGWFGVGLFKSRQKYRYLPFAESDFILSVIGEEFGFVGVLVLFALFALVIIFGIKTASRAKNYFGYLIAAGITLIYAVQVAVNALVVTGTIPPTGLPLPLISSGNTSLIVYMAAFGILYNISREEDSLNASVT